MWPKNWKPLLDKLFAAGLTLLVMLLIQSISAKREYKNTLQDQINKRPTTEQVNKQIADVKQELRNDDAEIKTMLQQHIEASKETDQRTIELIKSVDQKVNVLLNRTK